MPPIHAQEDVPPPRYESTRGGTKGLSFLEAVTTGLAEDGGLLVPDFIPHVPPQEWASWKGLSYTDLCFHVMRKFIADNEVPDAPLKTIIHKAYETFRAADCVTLTPLLDGTAASPLYLLELFHGPTYAFKDFALQFLGRLVEYIRRDARESMTILGATSGDTGSAAIAGFRGIRNVKCMILFPKGRTSRVQELQMTTVLEPNIHCVAVDGGTFDDCQNIVKAIFSSPAKKTLCLSAANSINWARILAQIVYYWFAALRLPKQGGPIDVCVPTGNFGNILAGYYARQMGAPIRRLIIASNANDILTRFYQTGEYCLTEVTPTISPSMDIQVSSNFERLLFDVFKRDATRLREKFATELPTYRTFNVTDAELEAFRKVFRAYRATEAETAETIRAVYATSEETQRPQILDPHTAVGVCCARKDLDEREGTDNTPVVVVATAHFGKFSDALTEILGWETIMEWMPRELLDLANKERKVTLLESTHGVEGAVQLLEEFCAA